MPKRLDLMGKRPDKVVRETATPPSEPLGTEAHGSGIVKWWRPEKGYGAVETNETTPWDVWFHFSDVELPGRRELAAGDRVFVHYVRCDQDSFKYVAKSVSRIVD